MPDNFAHRLTAVLEAAGKSQKDLADHLDITSQSVQGWASGKTVPKGSKRIEEAALFLGVDPKWLAFGGELEDPSHTSNHIDACPQRQAELRKEIELSMNLMLPGTTHTCSPCTLTYRDSKVFAIVAVAALSEREGKFRLAQGPYYQYLWKCMKAPPSTLGVTPMLLVYGVTADGLSHNPATANHFLDIVRDAAPIVDVYACVEPHDAAQILHGVLTAAATGYVDENRFG